MGRRNRALRGILCGPRKNISLFWSLFLSLPLSAALSLSFCLSIFLIPFLPGKQQMFSSCSWPLLVAKMCEEIEKFIQSYPDPEGERFVENDKHALIMLSSCSSSCVYSLFAEYPGTSRRHASKANENTHTHTQCNHLILK